MQRLRPLCGRTAPLIAILLPLVLLKLGHSVGPAIAAEGCSTVAAAQPLDGEEQSMLGLINSYRASNGDPPLSLVSSLEDSALWKSTDMAQNRYFEHDDLARGWQQRLNDCGYSRGYDGENIAEGYSGAQQTFDQWRDSPEHNRNMLDANFRAIGIGRADSSDGSWYWTTDFGGSAADNTGSSTTPPYSVLVPPLTAPSSAPSTVAVGSSEVSDTPGDCLRVHDGPSLSADVTACLPDATPVVIAGGPVTADGHVWWMISASGWVAGDLLRPAS